MKRLAFAALLACLASPALAADPTPPAKPPTVAELQVEIAQLKAALAVVRQQRDGAFQQANEEYVQQAVQAATPAK